MVAKIIFIVCLLWKNSVAILGPVSIVTVKTTDGVVWGDSRVFSLPESNEIYFVYEFKGIPYAKPPIGELRFKPPEEPVPYLVLNTTKNGNNCINIRGGDEDCLYLNIYTRNFKTTATSISYPVLVYFHGGGFQRGDAFDNNTMADYFILEEMVVVTINYRTNVFGFLNTMDDCASGNVGLKDQVAALKWINKNIDSFGGDPNCVTLFGTGAGASSIQYLILSPLAKGLFHRAIAESGSVFNPWAFLNENPKNLAFKLGEILGIETKNSKTLVKELQKVNAHTLFEAAYSMDQNRLPINDQSFSPSLERKSPGAFITGSSYETLENGNYPNNIPYLTGYNEDEGNITLEFVAQGQMNLSMFKDDPELLIPPGMNLKNGSSTSKEVAKEIVREYFNSSTENIIDSIYFKNYQSQSLIIRSIRKVVQLMSKYSKVFVYKFTYKTNNNIPNSDRPYFSPAIGHGAELAYLFNFNIPETPEDRLTRQRMVKLWCNFARTGNPTPTKENLFENITWTPVDNEESVPFLNIDERFSIINNDEQEHFLFWKQLYDKYWKPPYNVY